MGSQFLNPWLNLAAAVIFLAGAILALRQSNARFVKRGWFVIGLGLLALSAAAGIGAYAAFGSADLRLPLFSAAVILAGAVLLVAGFVVITRLLERQEQVNQVRQTELERLKHGFSSASELLVVKDTQGIYLAANPAFAAFLGKSLEALQTKSDFDFFPRSQANAVRQEEERLLSGGAVKAGIEDLRGAAGVRSLYVRRLPLKAEDGSITGLLFSALDITPWRQEAIQEQEQSQGMLGLHRAVEGILAASDEQTLYQAILEGACRLSGAGHAGLWLADGEHATLRLAAGSGKLADRSEITLQAGDDVAGLAWQANQLTFAVDYSAWRGRVPTLAEIGFASAAAVPLRANARMDGVIGLFYTETAAMLTPAAHDRLELFAAAAAKGLASLLNSSARQMELNDKIQAIVRYQQRLRVEHLVAAVAARFIQLNPGKIDEAILRSLDSLAKALAADRVYLILLPGEGLPILKSRASYSSTAERQADLPDPGSVEFSWVMGRLSQLETVYIPHSSELPAEMEEAAAYLLSRGLLCFAALPLIANRSMVGFLGLECRSKAPDWPPEILATLKLCAEMFVAILERKWSTAEQETRLQQTSQQILSLEQRARESALIAEMGDLLQACRTADEAYPIIARYAARLLPNASGALYLVRHAADPAENVAAWGNDLPGVGERELGPNECWGLRRGRPYSVQDTSSEPLCAHVHEPYPASYLCVPLVAQGVAAGVLHFRQNSQQAGAVSLDPARQQLAGRIAEYVALALTNLNLRDILRSQAIRDPLTGLFNRRYMEETLDREIRRASRHGTSVGVIMFDIDRMKPINDSYGHDAGDVLLRALGDLLLKSFRGEDVACRYGGDEFTIVLPEASLVDVWRRAEQMREGIKRLELKYEGRSLGPITLSIGVAAYPDHGLTAERVLLAADSASYSSKAEGGDRIMVGHDAET